MFVMFEQFSKVPDSILLTPSGIVMLVKFSHPENASFPIRVTLSGIVTVVMFEQSLKAPDSILLTPSGIITSVSPSSGIYFVNLLFSILKLILTLLFILFHLAKAPALSPIQEPLEFCMYLQQKQMLYYTPEDVTEMYRNRL